MLTEQEEKDILLSVITAQPNLKERVSRCVARAYTYVLDGAESFDELEGVEKTILGVKVEKYVLRDLGFRMKMTKETMARLREKDPTADISNTLLDTRIGGIDVDVKQSVSGNWMVPPEAFGKWLLVFKTNLTNMSYSMGIVNATKERLREKPNQDKKLSLKADAMRNIRWIIYENKIPI
jgi:hypothetical protein